MNGYKFYFLIILIYLGKHCLVVVKGKVNRISGKECGGLVTCWCRVGIFRAAEIFIEQHCYCAIGTRGYRLVSAIPLGQ